MLTSCYIKQQTIKHTFVMEEKNSHNTYITYPIVVTNTVIRLANQRPKAVASRAKQSEIVDLQLINQIPDLHYPTIPYNTLQYLQYLHCPLFVTNL